MAISAQNKVINTIKKEITKKGYFITTINNLEFDVYPNSRLYRDERVTIKINPSCMDNRFILLTCWLDNDSPIYVDITELYHGKLYSY